MPKQATPPETPPFLIAKSTSAVLTKRKVALAKRFSLKRMKDLFEYGSLLWLSEAAGEVSEAREAGAWLAGRITFSGDYNIWSPFAECLCHSARLARLAGDASTAKALLAPLVAHPALAEMPRERFIAWVGKTEGALLAAQKAKGASAVSGYLSACREACYFRETSGLGFYYDNWVDIAALDAIIAQALPHLRLP